MKTLKFFQIFLIYLRRFIRLLLVSLWLLLLLIPFILLRILNKNIGDNFPRYFHIGFLKILNIKINLVGKINIDKPGLLISNHASWVDISTLSSLTNISFIAKSEVSKWPLFGFLARLQDTLFIERRSIKAGKQKEDIRNILLKGKRLVLFPEGTSSDGNRVLKFKSSLFSIVENNDENYIIQAVTICYKGINGLPMSRSERPYIAWWGDMNLMHHLWKILVFDRIDIVVTAHEPIENIIDRKILSEIAWKQVSFGMGLALSGRPRSLKYDESIFDLV